MMKFEFEELAGYEVSDKDYYEVIEPMYMATDLSKQEFVKTINKKRFALKERKQYIKEMKAIAKHLFDISEHAVDYEAQEELRNLAQEYTDRFYNGMSYITFDDKKYFWACHYISTVEIINPKTGHTLETIKVA